jgi:hypothetical protein
MSNKQLAAQGLLAACLTGNHDLPHFLRNPRGCRSKLEAACFSRLLRSFGILLALNQSAPFSEGRLNGSWELVVNERVYFQI